MGGNSELENVAGGAWGGLSEMEDVNMCSDISLSDKSYLLRLKSSLKQRTETSISRVMISGGSYVDGCLDIKISLGTDQ